MMRLFVLPFFLLVGGCQFQTGWDGSEKNYEGIMVSASSANQLLYEKLKPALDSIQLQHREWETTVSFDLEEVPRGLVIKRLLQESHLPFLIDKVELSGRVTCCLKEAPLIEALNILLRDIEAAASIREEASEKMVWIHNAFRSEGILIPKENTQMVIRTGNCDHLMASTIRDSLFGKPFSQSGILCQSSQSSCALHPFNNSLYLRGPANEVECYLRMIREADRPLQHIEIDVVTYAVPDDDHSGSTATFLAAVAKEMSLEWVPGITLQDSAIATSTGLFINRNHPIISDTGPESEEASIFAADRPTQVTRLAQFSIRVANGETFTLKNGRSGYLLVTQFNSGIPSGELQEIDTGINFTVTPWVLPTQQIRIQVHSEISQFTANAELAADKQQSVTTTVMQVPDGGIVILTGSMRAASIYANEGWAWLRRMPLVEWLTGRTNYEALWRFGVTLLRCRVVQDQPPLHFREGLTIPIRLPVGDVPEGLSNMESIR